MKNSKLYYINDNNQWIWTESIKSLVQSLSSNNWSDELLELLDNRHQYLESIDKLSELSKNDLDRIPSGHQIITYGPSYGKTTAIRQWIVDKILDKSEYHSGIYSCKRNEDIYQIYIDIISYLPRSLYQQVMIYTSDINNKVLPEDIRSSSWIICSHERLLIEAPSVLYVDDSLRYSEFLKSSAREYLLIDEYPDSSNYKEIGISDYSGYLGIDYILGINPSMTNNQKNMIRYKLVSNLYDNPDDPHNTTILKLLDQIRFPVPMNYHKDLELSETRYKDKLLFFLNILCNKISSMYLNARSSSDSILDLNKIDTSLFYSLGDLPINNTWIFDGTGDLIFGNEDKSYKTKLWNIYSDDKYSRLLRLSSVNYIKFNSPRYSDDLYAISEIVDILKEIRNRNKSSNILVYLWKSVKSNNSEVSSIDTISHELNDPKINFISYMSGNEKSTSRYSSSDVLVILGNFYIPNNSIHKLNSVNHTCMTSNDYTLSLIIQFIYRSRARHGYSVKLYLDDNYSNIIPELFSKTKLSIDNSVSESIIQFDQHNKIYNKIMNTTEYISKSSKNLVMDFHQISKLLDISDKSNNVKRYLNDHNIPYTAIPGKGRSSTKFIFNLS